VALRKVVYRYKKKKKAKGLRGLHFPSVSLILLIFILLSVFFAIRNSQTKVQSSRLSQVPAVKSAETVNISPSEAPTSTPSPTVTPSPTPVPISPTPKINDYCVHVPVLLYHHVQPQALAVEKKQTALSVDSDIFDKQMSYLVNAGYTSINSNQLMDAILQKSPLPAKSVVITLDDGYKDAYTYAFPIFKKYNLIGNIMIPSGLMEGADYLAWSQIQEMNSSGKIFYTDHTWSHFALGTGTAEKIKSEIQTGRSQLESHIGQKIDIFTYPYGSFNNLAISLLRQEGFKAAFSTIHGFNQCQSFIMTLHRNHIGNAPLSAYGL